ncbi:MAG: TonB-dependent receptor [Bacteroidetes bacterium]|nr:TonB-dependent receptor [Bacteroidota bacterium]MBU1579681.1 TonB-dependent receptor [Bacteroidota bacterium]MBU2559130.1 TonB-dependent receptor [Bacteroidota bacterium]
MIKSLTNLFTFALLFGCFLQGYSQKAGISIVDSRNGEAIAFAHVLFEPLSGRQSVSGISSIDGFVENPLNEQGIFRISYVGYQVYADTILPGKSVKVQLKPLTYNIDEVVVTGQFTPQAVDKSIFRVKVIGAKQIDQRASNNLSELMAGELNIRSSNDGALGSKITLQGLGGEHIKFLVDGVPVIGRMNGNIDLDQLNLYNVAHIEIIEGPMSVIYGSNALAGVINIITKEHNYTTYQTNATAYVESVGVYNFSADASAKKGRWSGSVAAARNFFGGYSTIDSSRSKRWKPKRQYNADASMQYAHKELKARLSASYFNEMLIDKGNLLPTYYETAFDNHFITNRLTTKTDINTRLFKDRYLKVLASYAYYNRIKNNYFIDLTTLDKQLTLDSDDQDTSKFQQYLLRAEFSKSTENSPFNYQLGIDLNHESGSGKRILNQEQNLGDYAAFLSVKLKPSVRLMLQPGLRYSYNTKYKAPLVYSLNVKYDLGTETSFRASYAKGFRAPSLKELYLEFVDVNHNIRGNENLKAEHSQNINLSLRYHHEKDSYDYGAELNVFYNNIDNSISLAALDTESSLYTYINVDNTITQGYQLNFNNRVYPWLEIKLGVGQTGRKQVFSQLDDNEMIYSTDVITQLNYLWQRTDLRFNLYYKYNGAYPEVFIGEQDQIFKTIVSGYHTMDLSISKQFWKNRLTMQIGAKNIFDNTNINVTGDTGNGGIHSGGGVSSPVGWGRTYFVRMNISLKKF